MSSKYNRHSSVVNRQSEQPVDENTWLHRFEKSLLKDAVQTRKQDASLFEQINSIMNGKSKFPNVDAAVQDMKERSGLTAYLQKIKQSSNEPSTPSAKKVASADDQSAIDKKVDITPVVIKKHPLIMKTFENYIKSNKGNHAVPAIISHVQSIHQKDCSDAKDWDDDKLIRLVSKLNLSAKADNPESFQNYENLGTRDIGSEIDIDPSNSDAFHSLTPVKQ